MATGAVSLHVAPSSDDGLALRYYTVTSADGTEPTSFVAGKYDVLASSYDMLTASVRIPGAVHQELRATHFLPMEKPDEVHEALLDLLDRAGR